MTCLLGLSAQGNPGQQAPFDKQCQHPCAFVHCMLLCCRQRHQVLPGRLTLLRAILLQLLSA
jgi:hypothetical protein